MARGFAPTQARFLAASATASLPPSNGSSLQYRGFTSVVMATALVVPLMRMRAASQPGPRTVFVRTDWSYCV